MSIKLHKLFSWERKNTYPNFLSFKKFSIDGAMHIFTAILYTIKILYNQVILAVLSINPAESLSKCNFSRPRQGKVISAESVL